MTTKTVTPDNAQAKMTEAERLDLYERACAKREDVLFKRDPDSKHGYTVHHIEHLGSTGTTSLEKHTDMTEVFSLVMQVTEELIALQVKQAAEHWARVMVPPQQPT